MQDTDSTGTGSVAADNQLSNLQDWRYEVDIEKIAWAVFDRANEGVNSLGQRPLEELGEIVEQANQRHGQIVDQAKDDATVERQRQVAAAAVRPQRQEPC